jgi:hypothetical protein
MEDDAMKKKSDRSGPTGLEIIEGLSVAQLGGILWALSCCPGDSDEEICDALRQWMGAVVQQQPFIGGTRWCEAEIEEMRLIAIRIPKSRPSPAAWRAWTSPSSPAR